MCCWQDHASFGCCIITSSSSRWKVDEKAKIDVTTCAHPQCVLWGCGHGTAGIQCTAAKGVSRQATRLLWYKSHRQWGSTDQQPSRRQFWCHSQVSFKRLPTVCDFEPVIVAPLADNRHNKALVQFIEFQCVIRSGDFTLYETFVAGKQPCVDRERLGALKVREMHVSGPFSMFTSSETGLGT